MWGPMSHICGLSAPFPWWLALTVSRWGLKASVWSARWGAPYSGHLLVRTTTAGHRATTRLRALGAILARCQLRPWLHLASGRWSGRWHGRALFFATAFQRAVASIGGRWRSPSRGRNTCCERRVDSHVRRLLQTHFFSPRSRRSSLTTRRPHFGRDAILLQVASEAGQRRRLATRACSPGWRSCAVHATLAGLAVDAVEKLVKAPDDAWSCASAAVNLH